jgi:hypothetical protein
METVIGELSGTNFINCTRGVEGTASAWAADIVVEILFTATHWDKLVTWAEVEHNQDGTHSDVTADSVTSGTIEATTSADLKTLAIDGGTAMTAVKDEDDMASNSATALATQQSIKAYSDNITGNRFKTGYGIYSATPSASYTTTSASYEDVTGGTLDITTTGGRLLVQVSVPIYTNTGNWSLAVLVDGTDYVIGSASNTSALYASGFVVITGLAAGTYTIKLRFNAAGTTTIPAYYRRFMLAYEI